jgi:hypothetical protein
MDKVDKKKLLILGTSPTLKLAPVNDPSFEVWGLNDMFTVLPRADRWFEMHPRQVQENSIVRNSKQNYLEWFKNTKIPVYMQEKFEDIPSSIKYPLDEMIRKFGVELFGSTVDYEMALALSEGYKEIYIYGVDMAVNEEYSQQRPSLYFWIGIAMGMGVKVFMPDGCDLLKSYFKYGYEELKETDFHKKATDKIKYFDDHAIDFLKNYYVSMGSKEAWENILKETGGL